MSRRVPSGPTRVITGRTHQVSVRIPHDLHAALAARGPIAAQLVEAARDMPARTETCATLGRMAVELTDEIQRLRAALRAIAYRADPGKNRTFDECSADLYWCLNEVRRVTAAEDTTHER